MKKGWQNPVWGWQRMLSVLAALSTGPWEPQEELAGEVRTQVGLPLGEEPSQGCKGLVAAAQ